MKTRTAGKIVIGTITLAIVLVFLFFAWPGWVWGGAVASGRFMIQPGVHGGTATRFIIGRNQ